MSQQNWLSVAAGFIQRDLLLAFRNRGELMTPLLFLLGVAVLFPLGLGPDPERLREIAPGVIWVASLLAALLSLQQLFSKDYEDGGLEQLLINPVPLPLLVAARTIAHWLTSGLPITLMSPLLAVTYGLDTQTMGVVIMTLLLGTPTLSFIGVIGVALSVGLRKGGMFLSLLVLPLYIPVLIFATAGIASSQANMEYTSHLFLLGGLALFSLSLSPFVTAAALKMSLE